MKKHSKNAINISLLKEIKNIVKTLLKYLLKYCKYYN